MKYVTLVKETIINPRMSLPARILDFFFSFAGAENLGGILDLRFPIVSCRLFSIMDYGRVRSDFFCPNLMLRVYQKSPVWNGFGKSCEDGD